MADFPDDVIIDILTRLPVKSLLRFRLVSKHFVTLIDSSDFVKQHLNHSLKTKNNHNLILNHAHLECVDLYSLDQPIQLHHPLKPSPFDIEILGSVNGLLCLFNGEKDIVIWNVATKRYQRLPLNDIEVPLTTQVSYVIYGFGYDSVCDDYKLVRLVQFYKTDSDSDEEGNFESSFDNEAKLYSLRSKSWQKIQVLPYFLRYRKGHGVLACGALHWIVSHTSNLDAPTLIASFDLATNEYRLIDKPDIPDKGFHMNVGELGGCLCVISNSINDHVDVWVMRNYGDKDSWSILYSVSQPRVISPFDFVTPLAYTKMGNEILLVQHNRKLLMYNLEEKRARTINVRGFPVYFEPAICVGSLVPLSGKAEEYAIKRRRKKRRGKKRFGEE